MSTESGPLLISPEVRSLPYWLQGSAWSQLADIVAPSGDQTPSSQAAPSGGRKPHKQSKKAATKWLKQMVATVPSAPAPRHHGSGQPLSTHPEPDSQQKKEQQQQQQQADKRECSPAPASSGLINHAQAALQITEIPQPNPQLQNSHQSSPQAPKQAPGMQRNASSRAAEQNGTKQLYRYSMESWTPAECLQHMCNLAKVTRSRQHANKQLYLDQLLQRMCKLVATCQPSQLSTLANALSDLHAQGWTVDKPKGGLPFLPGLLLRATSRRLRTFNVPDFCVVSQALTDILGPQSQLQGLALELCLGQYPNAAALTHFEKVCWVCRAHQCLTPS